MQWSGTGRTRIAHDKGFSKGRLSSHDAEPDEQAARGIDEEPDEQPGNSKETFKVEQQEGEDDDYPNSNSLPDLADFLRRKGWSADDIEEACRVAGSALDMTTDAEPQGGGPPDLPLGGRPTPGKNLTPLKQSAAMDARSLASRIGVATSFGTQNFGAPVTPRRVIGADTSTRALAGFASRWPEVARVKQA
jgi:hypothetical protein